MPITNWIGTYDQDRAIAFAGMLAEGQPARDVASKVVETAAVAFGLAVGKGTADNSVKLGGTGFTGITLADKAQTADEFAGGTMAAVIRKGTVWVTASTNVTPADPVTFTAATGVIGAGLVTTITNAKFETTATAGNLVRVYLG